MFILSAKLTKTKIMTVALVSACVVLLLLISLPTGIKASKNTVQGETNEERVAYLKTFGWEVSADPVEVISVVIPEEFDSTYKEYNDLQVSQGFDLTGHRGDSGTRYTYAISNYPNGEATEAFANVIVIDDQIVAADVSGVSGGGFMHTLQMPEKSSAPVTSETPTSGGLTRDDILDAISPNVK